ncbi:MAG TPA: hypothetical protein VF126_06990 [Acidobacteriaceae bacterium]
MRVPPFREEMLYTAWVRRLIANLLTCWMLLLVPGATALELARPQLLLPACCRTHGAHHCVTGSVQHEHGPAWRGAGCPFANLQHAAVLLAPHMPAAPHGLVCTVAVESTLGFELAALSAFLAGLPASRAPPSFA